LQVSPAVLIPRPETEILIDLVVAASEQIVRSSYPQQWADLGTGSGAIAIGLARALPNAIIHAVDTSPAALAVARQNVQAQRLSARIHLYQGSWLTPLVALKGQLTGIVSNPPYIPTEIIADLQPEVVGHEPHLALDGGTDGLGCLREIIATAPDYLTPSGILLLEMMQGQSEAVKQLLETNGAYTHIQIHPDLSGIQRFASAQRD
jgi:release factor glutamine methyltransferase